MRFRNLFTDKRHYLLAVFLILLLLHGSCGEKRKERKLEKFDSIAWKTDRDGCNGIRVSMKDNLLKSKYTMRGLTTREVLDLMGHPDAEELADRNQKYYIYFIEPGPACTGFGGKATALYVRFSAVGIANEFTFREFTP
jgi:hypothetical protein